MDVFKVRILDITKQKLLCNKTVKHTHHRAPFSSKDRPAEKSLLRLFSATGQRLHKERFESRPDITEIYRDRNKQQCLKTYGERKHRELLTCTSWICIDYECF